eukprot:6199716-Pleurochrysis_carterae.AAC.1
MKVSGCAAGARSSNVEASIARATRVSNSDAYGLALGGVAPLLLPWTLRERWAAALKGVLPSEP